MLLKTNRPKYLNHTIQRFRLSIAAFVNNPLKTTTENFSAE